MKFILSLTTALLLSACATTQDPTKGCTPVTVKEVEYIIKIPPKKLMTPPAQVPNIDVDSAKQSDIAKWIIANEDRTRELENMLRELAAFFKVEQERLNEEAESKNAAARAAAAQPKK